jgi:Pin2-interacting protein X1
MGLAGTKNKTKLSHDPNNTAWSRSTTNFGHKILAAQGWKPGDYLGAENASHSGHYTAANASHIRVMLREENLGIGAQVGKGNAETFGLSMFSGLLGRLNGKSDGEVEKQQNALRDVQLSTFQAQRYGFMNFVSGGLLVGDKMEFPKSTVMVNKAATGKESKGTKRKAEQDNNEQPSSKRSKDVVNQKSADESSDDSSDLSEAAASAKKRKQRQTKSEKGTSSLSDTSSRAAAKELRRREKADRKAARAAAKASKSSGDDGDKARLKAEKRARKEERRKRKEEKRRRRAERSTTEAQTSTAASANSSDSDGTATPPVASGGFAGGRHAVRQRYIQQKRMASMDPQALKEIFMLQQPKPVS